MPVFTSTPGDELQLSAFLAGKSAHTLMLFHHFIAEFNKIGNIKVETTKTMIGISNNRHRIAWVTQLGKNFIHIVFPFKQEYPDNLCFQKVGQVPGQQQYNHHFRMLNMEDVNEEVLGFMKLAYHDEIK
ncbi:hypothetical protein IDJ77_01545 [Mucilaginibacter sp. ZT4R22]|uniref:DUF5655 domain-containing protein n=1 Tax=Mucilaginibacter pankratovii TaxID=2772110 RepID=A0ABR7WJY9_9SPHI|nr:DUF5655 domain-containing protein [Mucilaginibacter pankratovii]MBD1362481.1 hypothetical protein [Mucilaginibacter pankratovii]